MRYHILAIGKVHGPFAEMIREYGKRFLSPLVVRELSGATAKAEGEALLRAVPKGAKIVLLDERGKDLSSLELAGQIAKWQEAGAGDLAFLLGGADGFTPEVREKADFVLGLGRKTWPHKLARVMLMEQLYRAQQINAGHPYHRE